jgi:hypothetical protein
MVARAPPPGAKSSYLDLKDPLSVYAYEPKIQSLGAFSRTPPPVHEPLFFTTFQLVTQALGGYVGSKDFFLGPIVRALKATLGRFRGMLGSSKMILQNDWLRGDELILERVRPTVGAGRWLDTPRTRC